MQEKKTVTLDKVEPVVKLTEETLLLLKAIADLTDIEEEEAALAAALATFRQALGGEPEFHEEEINKLCYEFEVFRGLAELIIRGDLNIEYDNGTLRFSIKR